MKYDQIIIIPAYKPRKSLIQFIGQLLSRFENIVVIDDGSKEEYRYVFSVIENEGCIVLTHKENRGKGEALKTAIAYCLSKPEISRAGIITVDADGQHKLVDIVRVADIMNSNFNSIVVGCRKFNTGKIPLRSLIGNIISRIVYKWIVGIGISDTQTGLRGLPFGFLPIAYKSRGNRYEYETNMLIDIKKHGFKIIEIEIETVYENNNESSHFRPLIDSCRIYAVIIKYSLSSLISVISEYIVFGIALHFDVSILFATYVARGISCIINFSMNKRLVFKKNGNAAVQFVRYFLLVIISGTISGYSVTWISEVLFQTSPIIIKMLVELNLFFLNFVVQKKLIFYENDE